MVVGVVNGQRARRAERRPDSSEVFIHWRIEVCSCELLKIIIIIKQSTKNGIPMACLLQAGSPFADGFRDVAREGRFVRSDTSPIQPQPFKQWLYGYVTSHVCFIYHLTGGRIRGCKLNVEVQAQQRLSELNLSCGRCPTLRTEMSTAECDWLLHEGVVASAIPELFDTDTTPYFVPVTTSTLYLLLRTSTGY